MGGSFFSFALFDIRIIYVAVSLLSSKRKKKVKLIK